MRMLSNLRMHVIAVAALGHIPNVVFGAPARAPSTPLHYPFWLQKGGFYNPKFVGVQMRRKHLQNHRAKAAVKRSKKL